VSPPRTPTPPSIAGFPNQINTVDLKGYKLVTSYPSGANGGFTPESWRARVEVANGETGGSPVRSSTLPLS